MRTGVASLLMETMTKPNPAQDEALSEWEASAALIELPSVEALEAIHADARRDSVVPSPSPLRPSFK